MELSSSNLLIFNEDPENHVKIVFSVSDDLRTL